MIYSPDCSSLVAERLAAIRRALATVAVPELGSPTAAGMALTRDACLAAVTQLGGLLARLAHAAQIADECASSDQLSEFWREHAPSPAELAEAESRSDWLSLCCPGWAEVTMPGDLGPSIERVEADIRWFVARDIGCKDHWRALATLRQVSLVVSLLESVSTPAAEEYPNTIVQALDLVRTRHLLRRSREEGSS